MTFIILMVLAFLIILIFRKYRTIYSVIIVIAVIFGITTIVSVAMALIAKRHMLQFFNGCIGHGELYYLMAAWYAADAVCSALIIRNHISCWSSVRLKPWRAKRRWPAARSFPRE